MTPDLQAEIAEMEARDKRGAYALVRNDTADLVLTAARRSLALEEGLIGTNDRIVGTAVSLSRSFALGVASRDVRDKTMSRETADMWVKEAVEDLKKMLNETAIDARALLESPERPTQGVEYLTTDEACEDHHIPVKGRIWREP